MDTAVSPELRAYAERARAIPSLLACALRAWSVAQLQSYLGCDEQAALRVLVCNAPRPSCWAEDLTAVAAFAAVDRRRLAAVLRAAGATLPADPRVPGQAESTPCRVSAG